MRKHHPTPEAAKEIKAVVDFMKINGQHILKKRIVIEEVSRFLDVPGGEVLRELFEQFRNLGHVHPHSPGRPHDLSASTPTQNINPSNHA